jgi:hypothetical protein
MDKQLLESWIIGLNHILVEYDLNEHTIFALMKLRQEMYELLKKIKYDELEIKNVD